MPLEANDFELQAKLPFSKFQLRILQAIQHTRGNSSSLRYMCLAETNE